jgi:hypothetical protein
MILSNKLKEAYDPWHWKAHAKNGAMPAMGVTGSLVIT